MRKYGCFLLILLFACQADKESEKTKRFTRLSSDQTGIDFVNVLTLKQNFDVFRYRNYYNGGGVAIGDVNNDGLSDVYLTANMQSNKLYLNKGNFTFEDITEKAGVGGNKTWSTGVSMADINGDGLLDIYVCNSGDVMGGNRENELFINNGDLTFSERSAEYGLDDKGFSTHAVFFDYDQDTDLDCYVLNNSFRPVSSLGYENIRHVRDSTGGDKLYRNDTPLEPVWKEGGVAVKFTDISQQAGIFGSVIGFGLGVTITDVNLDGWLDLYVSNDFFERDYLYMNRGDGTFSEELPGRIGHISNYSMGADAADINNDGFPDIYVTDMLPDTDYRLKTTTNYASYDIHQVKLANGYYEQYMRNTLQLNRGQGSFQEIGQMAGIEATDWSWGALLADFDNNGYKEIFVTNGVYKDVTDQDFITFLANEENMLAAMRQEKVDFQELVNKMPSNKIANYLFKKNGDLTYHNAAAAWGLDEPSFSNGAAYGDLDNDGDLDLVVNNVNQELFVYRNETDTLGGGSYLKLSFKGPGQNTFGIGARANAYFDNQQVMLENIPTKGFQSSMDYGMVMGLGEAKILDSLVVHWGYGKKQTLTGVSTNRQLVLDIRDAAQIHPVKDQTIESSLIFSKIDSGLTPFFRHKENTFVDFNSEQLIYHMLSREGPALAVADINGDGLDDFYIGGATGSPGSLYMQDSQGNFLAVRQGDFSSDRIHEDVDAVFFDADGDQDLDLYVVSGGYSFANNSPEYQDRLYLMETDKNGRPLYVRAKGALPVLYDMGSCVEVSDFDNDGDEDLFVGGRAVPGRYGFAATSRLLVNDGSGNFEDLTSRVAPGFGNLGMVTAAQWADYDNDGDKDMVIVGEWMTITLFKNNGVNLERLNNVPGLVNTSGWWNSLKAADLDEDGDMDFIAGNWGLNSMFGASAEEPVTLFMHDFDQNNTVDHVFAYHQDDKLLPMALKGDLVKQLPYLKKNFIYYKDYAGKTVEEVFGQEKLAKAYVNRARELRSVIVWNKGDGTYEIEPLPMPVQLSPVFAIAMDDFYGQGQQQLLMAGNFSGVKPEEGRYDANHGVVLQVEGGQISVADHQKSGLDIYGDVRNVRIARSVNGRKLLIVAKNNDEPEIYRY